MTIEQYTTDELLAEIKRRTDTSTDDGTGAMATCGNCGVILWPNQTHTCPTVITTSTELNG